VTDTRKTISNKNTPLFIEILLSGDHHYERPLHNLSEGPLWTFWGTHPGEANGPANPKLFEAVRPSFWDLVSKPTDGSKSSYKGARRGYAKVSTSVPEAATTGH
jgi:hypothetical protein